MDIDFGEERNFKENSTHAARLAIWTRVFDNCLSDDVSPAKAARKANQVVETFDEKFVDEQTKTLNQLRIKHGIEPLKGGEEVTRRHAKDSVELDLDLDEAKKFEPEDILEPAERPPAGE